MKKLSISVNDRNYTIEYQRKENGSYSVFFTDNYLIELLGNPFEFGIDTHREIAQFSYETDSRTKPIIATITQAINEADASAIWGND